MKTPKALWNVNDMMERINMRVSDIFFVLNMFLPIIL